MIVGNIESLVSQAQSHKNTPATTTKQPHEHSYSHSLHYFLHIAYGLHKFSCGMTIHPLSLFYDINTLMCKVRYLPSLDPLKVQKIS